MNSQNQPQAQKYNQQVPQQASHSVFFNNQQRASVDRSESFPFFQHNKNITDKHLTRNKPHYSEDEDYFSQNQQQFNTNQENNNWNIDQPDPIYQPDLFEPDSFCLFPCVIVMMLRQFQKLRRRTWHKMVDLDLGSYLKCFYFFKSFSVFCRPFKIICCLRIL